MNMEIEKQKSGESAAANFGNGYHCAEAVVAGVLESMGEESQAAVSHATAFGGGLGESFSEVCGVVSGSLIVVGHFYGRKAQGESWRNAAELGGAVVRKFAALHGTCNCGELRERFGEEEQMDLCRNLVKLGTENLLELLLEKSAETSENAADSSSCGSCS